MCLCVFTQVILPIVRGEDFAHYSQIEDPEFNKKVKEAMKQI